MEGRCTCHFLFLGYNTLSRDYLSRGLRCWFSAKEQEVYDDGSGKEKKDGVKARPAQKRYVPLVKEVRDGSGSGSGVSRGDTLHRLRRCGDFFGSGIMMIGNGIMGMWKEGERDRREYGRDHERRCRDCDGIVDVRDATSAITRNTS
jgi:hypothetical protein